MEIVMVIKPKEKELIVIVIVIEAEKTLITHLWLYPSFILKIKNKTV
jgi:hypothetical protein